VNRAPGPLFGWFAARNIYTKKFPLILNGLPQVTRCLFQAGTQLAQDGPTLKEKQE
jgi:hypothetical protein